MQDPIFKPLHSTAAPPVKVGRLRAIMKWLDQRLPLLLYYEESPQRRATKAQLQERPSFPSDLWRKRSIDPALAESVLVVLSREFEWPNHFFMPEDPIRLMLQEGMDDWPWDEFVWGVHEALRRDVSLKDIVALHHQDATAADLVALVANVAIDT